MKRTFILSAILCFQNVTFIGYAQIADVYQKALMIVKTAEKYHYHPRPVDDKFSEMVFASFLERLDPFHMYFTKTDIEILENSKYIIDNEIFNQKCTFLQKTKDLYKKEAEKDFPAIIDFYIKKDNFEKVQKTFESKNKKSRTQQDVDQYNKAANEYNEAAQKANQISELSANERTKHINELNKWVDKFFDTHAN